MTAVVNDLSFLSVFLVAGLALREIFKPLQKLFLPAGLIGGAVALIMGPQVLGLIEIPKGWGGMMTPMINVVLTCLIFGTTLNKERMKAYAGSINVIVLSYFSQMLIGTLVGMALMQFWPGMPEGWGVMAIYTYWGGHGAGSSAGKLFEELGVNGMLNIGLILSTLGLIIAMLWGMLLVNYGVRRGYAKNVEKGRGGRIEVESGPLAKDKQQPLGYSTVSSDAIGGLALQLALVLICMWVGAKLFGYLAEAVPASKNVPSLLHGIVGAAIVWFIMCRLKIDGYADKASVNSISNLALEICVCAATATLNLKFFAEFLAPILIHMAAIILLMTFLCMVLVRRWFGEDWFESALLYFGQGTGSSPSGMALARCVDPNMKNSRAWEGFGTSLGVFTPVTSTLVAVIPPLAVQSIWIPIGIGAAVTVGTLLFGELVLRKRR